MAKTEIPTEIQQILDLCKCPVCDKPLELGRQVSDYEFVPLVVNDSFPSMKEGQNPDGFTWSLYCSHKPEHDVDNMLSVESMELLTDWVDKRI